jgi:hypothetical protein
VTRLSPLCVPRFTGDNGGATHQGVTRNEIVVVKTRQNLPEFLETVLRQGDLGSTKAEEDDHMAAWAAFFEKHYELYGRKIKWISHQVSCTTGDPSFVGCMRQEARTINQQYKPFYVLGLGLPLEFLDELTRLGVMTAGGFNLYPDHIYTARRPYLWDIFTDGDRVERNVADYWCKKMAGKPASRAGDPLIQARRRKLGIMTLQATDPSLQAGRVLAPLVSGGRCGTAGDKPPVVVYSGDPSQAANQMSAAVGVFKQEMVTTVVCLCDAITPVFMTQAMDDQQYFPEHLLSGGGAIDVDQLGRLYTQTQWRNAFGPGLFTDQLPVVDADQSRAWRDAGRSGATPCLVCGGFYIYMELVVFQLQWAGPVLTPANVERGTLSAPPLGGWTATRGDPYVPMLRFGRDEYTAYEDARDIYWNPAAQSRGDGKAGAYISVQGGRRHELETWPAGEPAT